MTVLLMAFLCLILIGVALYSWMMLNEARRERDAARERATMAENGAAKKVADIEAKIVNLQPYRDVPGILDRAKKVNEEVKRKLEIADQQVEAMVLAAQADARQTRDSAQREADQVRRDAEHDAKRVREAAATELRLASSRAEMIKGEALEQAKAEKKQFTAAAKAKHEKAEAELAEAGRFSIEVRETADARAKQFLGVAYEPRKEAAEYQRIAEAMRNIIEGYGTRYLETGDTILDQLAEEYGFDDAGRKLKLARDAVRLMIQNGTAATCLYEPGYKRDFALGFVLDAFNGRVSEVFTKIKRETFGTLKRRIEDAFALTNHNAEVLRGTRITEEFLAARIKELKCALVVRTLAMRRQEEQREIRDRMREEEKARKEYERAIKQTEREEALINKAIEEVRSQYDAASAEDRAGYEARLKQLEAERQAAEEKNRRAVSMAEQTRRGYVYVISNIGSFGEDIYKIGLSRRLQPEDRVRELGDASVPFRFDTHALIFSEDAPALETALHRRFVQRQVNKSNRRKEFFRIRLSEIRDALSQLRLEKPWEMRMEWTIEAEAREYRETQALEAAMNTDAAVRDRWLADQNRFSFLDVLGDEEEDAETSEAMETASLA